MTFNVSNTSLAPILEQVIRKSGRFPNYASLGDNLQINLTDEAFYKKIQSKRIVTLNGSKCSKFTAYWNILLYYDRSIAKASRGRKTRIISASTFINGSLQFKGTIVGVLDLQEMYCKLYNENQQSQNPIFRSPSGTVIQGSSTPADDKRILEAIKPSAPIAAPSEDKVEPIQEQVAVAADEKKAGARIRKSKSRVKKGSDRYNRAKTKAKKADELNLLYNYLCQKCVKSSQGSQTFTTAKSGRNTAYTLTIEPGQWFTSILQLCNDMPSISRNRMKTLLYNLAGYSNTHGKCTKVNFQSLQKLTTKKCTKVNIQSIGKVGYLVTLEGIASQELWNKVENNVESVQKLTTKKCTKVNFQSVQKLTTKITILNNKEEKDARTDDDFIQGLVAAYPRLMAMDEPLTHEQYISLRNEGYTKEQLINCCKALNNQKQLTRKYASAYEAIQAHLNNKKK